MPRLRTLLLASLLVGPAAAQERATSEETLPAGALKRLGSTAYRLDGSILDISRDGKWLVGTEDSNRRLVIMEAASGKIIRRADLNQMFIDARFSRDSNRVLWLTEKAFETREIESWKLHRLAEFEDSMPGFRAMSQDGSMLIQRHYDDQKYSISFFDATTLKKIGSYPTASPLNECIYSLSSDVTLVAIRTPDVKGDDNLAEPDGWVEVRNLETRKTIARIRSDASNVEAMAFSADGKKLAICGSYSVQVWDLKTAKADWSWPESVGDRSLATFSPDGRILYLASSGVVKSWDLSTGKRRKSNWFIDTVEKEYWNGVRWLDDGRLIGWRNNYHLIELWNLQDRKRLNPQQGHLNPVESLAFNSEDLICSACINQPPLVWQPATGKLLGPLALPDDGSPQPPWRRVGPASFSPGSRYLFIPVSYNNDAHFPPFVGQSLWDLQERRCIAHDWVHGAQGSERMRVFTPNDRYVAIVDNFPHNRRSQILAFDLETGRPIRGLKLNHYCDCIRFSPDSRILAAVDYDRDEKRSWLVGWEIPSGKQSFRYELPARRPYALAFLDHRRIVAVDISQYDRKPETAIVTLDVQTGKRLGWPVDSIELPDVDFPLPIRSRDGRLLTMMTKKGIALVETASGSVRHLFEPTSPVHSFTFSRDDRMLATGHRDTSILTWDLTKASSEIVAKEPAAIWEQLGITNAARGWAAMHYLIENTEPALRLFREKIQPTLKQKPVELTTIPRLVAALEAERFIERDRAINELIRAGRMALPDLEKALKNPGSEESRKRLETVRERILGPENIASYLAHLRAIEVLERIGTPAAIEHLSELASGGDSPPTRAARQSLERLNAKAGREPQSPK